MVPTPISVRVTVALPATFLSNIMFLCPVELIQLLTVVRARTLGSVTPLPCAAAAAPLLLACNAGTLMVLKRPASWIFTGGSSDAREPHTYP